MVEIDKGFGYIIWHRENSEKGYDSNKEYGKMIQNSKNLHINLLRKREHSTCINKRLGS